MSPVEWGDEEERYPAHGRVPLWDCGLRVLGLAGIVSLLIVVVVWNLFVVVEVLW